MLHLFTVFSFFSAGIFFFSLPYLPDLRIRLGHFLLDRPDISTSIAFGFFLTAFLLLIGFYGLNRGRFLRIEMGKHTAEIDAEVIRQTLDPFFKKRFPKEMDLSDVEVINGKKLEIIVHLAMREADLEEDLLLRTEKGLQELLRERFGHSRPFYLIVRTSK